MTDAGDDLIDMLDLLDAVEGIAYVVAPDFTIRAIGPQSWRTFAEANATPALADSPGIVGKSLFEFIAGDEVQAWYRRCFDAIARDERRSLTFEYRCDGPDCARECRLSISAIGGKGAPRGYLFQSVVLHERVRPPVTLFEPEQMLAAVQAQAHLPILTLCGICQRLHADKEADSWIEAEEYYRRGGSGDVRISHGICPRCVDIWEQDAA